MEPGEFFTVTNEAFFVDPGIVLENYPPCLMFVVSLSASTAKAPTGASHGRAIEGYAVNQRGKYRSFK